MTADSRTTTQEETILKERYVPAWVVMAAVENAIGAESVVGLEARGDDVFAVLTEETKE